VAFATAPALPCGQALAPHRDRIFDHALPLSQRPFRLSRTNLGVVIIMKNGLKTAALAFGISFLLGGVALVHADSVDNSSESHRSETTTNAAPPPAVVRVQPAPVAVVPAPEVAAAPITNEHSSSHSASSESSPNGDSASEKSSSSRSSTGY
jgi:hypothetical protein